jgi:LPXTG-motif cell wall-anchored protein
MVTGGTLQASPPTISGLPAVGENLTASAGAWGPGAVDLGYQWLRDGSPIADATAADYTLTNDDAAAAITVAVTGAKPGFDPATTTSAPTQVVTGGSLTVAVPTIAGTPAVGQVLSADPGNWAPAPVLFGYQWSRDGSAIDGATASDYTLVNDDAGHTLTVAVMGSKPSFDDATLTSPPTAHVTGGALQTAVPTISGQTVVGQLLTVSTGDWGSSVGFAYQWSRNGAPIPDATASGYSLGNEDAGATITVAVTGTAAGFDAATVSSAPTSLVTGGTLTAASPSMPGSPVVGQPLTVSEGAWGPAPVSFAYQWLRDGSPIDVATAASYTPVNADAGHSLAVLVTGSKPGFDDASQQSALTTFVTGGALETAVPTISGASEVGQELAAHAGSWGPDPVGLSYQWLRDGVPIPGAGSVNYTLTNDDADTAVTVAVTGDKLGFDPATETSAATARVTGGTLTTAVPTMDGQPVVGSVLTAVPGAWGPAPVELSYAWSRDGVVIPEATTAEYTLTQADAGSTLTVAVTGSKRSFVSATTASDSTGLVTGGILSPAVPTVSGAAMVGGTLTANAGVWAPAPVALAYQWSRSGAPVPGATSADYTLVAADAGAAMTVTVTGSKVGFDELAMTSAATPLVVTPASAPTSTPDSDLTDAARGGVSVPQSASPGDTVTVTFGDGFSGERMLVWLHSTPRLIAADSVSAGGTLEVTIPADTPLGQHRIVVQNADGSLHGWTELTIVAKGAPNPEALPNTGLAPFAGVVAAIVLLLVGIGVLVFRRRRRPHGS